MSDTNRIILASSSPRRRELLDQIGVHYVRLPVDVDESPRERESPEQYVVRVAGEKSLLVQRSERTKLPVLGADTAVVLAGEIMGKPRGRDHALAMLARLSGRRHQVMSAVSVRSPQQHWQALNISTVSFRTISREEMLAYWATGEPVDKAGAYAIQGVGALFVKHIEGSFSGVVGLPLFETADLLRRAGIFLLRSESNET
jgi:nucleoside triphosphate pyrophosphatase